MSTPTISDRLGNIDLLLARIEGCARIVTLEEVDRLTSVEKIADAMLEDLGKLSTQLQWLKDLDSTILLLPAPDIDEQLNLKQRTAVATE